MAMSFFHPTAVAQFLALARVFLEELLGKLLGRVVMAAAVATRSLIVVRIDFLTLGKPNLRPLLLACRRDLAASRAGGTVQHGSQPGWHPRPR